MAVKRKRQRNLKKLVADYLRSIGWFVADVEVRYGLITKDLFGVADLIAMDDKYTDLVQVTSQDHRWSHRKTIETWLATDEGKAWVTNKFRQVYLAWVTPTNRIVIEAL